MAALRYIVPALAFASSVTAQFGSINTCSTSATATVSTQAQATQLTSCEIYQGSIQVENSGENIDLSGINIVTGDLNAINSTSSSFTASTLSVIGGSFYLNGLTSLTTLAFPSLVNVGSIKWTALPVLNGLQFSQGVRQLKSLDIENTGLQSLQGINLELADNIMIVNNQQLQKISMQIANVSVAMTIASNNAQLSVEFPNLVWANNMTLRDCQTLSTPSLSSINGSYSIYTGGFSTYSAPNLTDVGGALSFVENSALNNISLPELVSIGNALYVVSNPKLDALDGMPSLKRVGGNILGYGAFENITLPDLTSVKGTFNVTSTVSNMTESCDHFNTLKNSGAIQGRPFICHELPSASSSSSGSGSGSSSGSSSGSGAKSAAPSLLIPGVSTVLLGVVALCFGLL